MSIQPSRLAPYGLVTLFLLAGCSDPPAIQCGDGTRLVGTTCVPIANDAGDAMASEVDAPTNDAGRGSDAGGASDAGRASGDVGPMPQEGEPCPGGQDVCYDDVPWNCGRLPSAPQATLTRSTLRCNIVSGGYCAVDRGRARCRGGVWEEPCDYRTDTRRCVTDRVMATCGVIVNPDGTLIGAMWRPHACERGCDPVTGHCAP